jgi:hypothetical protein
MRAATTWDGPSQLLAECVQKLGLKKENYHSALDATPRFGSTNVKVTGPRYVVIELDETEARETAWKPGFYLLTISVNDALKILKNNKPEPR